MYELRDKQTPYWFINDEVSCIQESLGAAYRHEGFPGGWRFVKLQVNSLILKNGNTKSWLISDYIDSYSYHSRPWDRRYVSLSASYTLDYGKKINHGSNLKFNGNTKTSVL